MKLFNTRRGSVLFFSLIILSVLTYTLVTLLSGTQTDILQTRHYNNYKRTEIVAEAGAEKALADIWELIIDYNVNKTSLDAIAPPELSADGFLYTFPDSQVSSYSVKEMNSGSGTTIQEISTGNFKGHNGFVRQYEVISGAQNAASGKFAVIERIVQQVSIPLFQFGVFYENDLDIHPGGELTFIGPIHTNSSFYGSGDLNLYGQLTAAGAVFFGERSNGESKSVNEVYIATDDSHSTTVGPYDGDSNILDHNHSDWQSLSDFFYNERVKDSAHGVEKLQLPIPKTSPPHDIIERPDVNDDDSVKNAKFANNAHMRVQLTSSGEMRLQTKSGSGWSDWDSTEVNWQVTGVDGVGDPIYDKTKLVNVSTAEVIASTGEFTDMRESGGVTPPSHNIQVVQVDVANLTSLTSYPSGGKMVYVQNDRVQSGKQAGVRLVNGATLPSSGLSFASPDPLYIWGDYNTTKYSGQAAPSMVAGDAITILSSQWDDNKSNWSFNNKNSPTEITVNGVFFTGDMDGSTDYNGGLENLMRFLEKWNKTPVNINGGLICLWRSEIADGKWKYGNPIYTAPTRNFAYDPAYSDSSHAPPGIPFVMALETISWQKLSKDEALDKLGHTAADLTAN